MSNPTKLCPNFSQIPHRIMPRAMDRAPKAKPLGEWSVEEKHPRQ